MIRHTSSLLLAGIVSLVAWAGSTPPQDSVLPNILNPVPQAQPPKGQPGPDSKKPPEPPKTVPDKTPPGKDSPSKGGSDDGPKDNPKKKPGPQTPAANPVNEQNLADMLKKLGFQVEEHKLQGARPSWKITAQKKDWHYEATLLALQHHGKLTGFMLISRLGQPLGRPDSLPSIALVKLLQRNLDIAPYNFAYHEKTGGLCLQRDYSLAALQEKGLDKALEEFFNVIRQTHPDWGAPALQVAGTGNPDGPNPPGGTYPVPPVPKKDGLVGTHWEGEETLTGYGKLQFYFLPRWGAVMVDARDTVPGSWSWTGDKVTLQFLSGKVTYHGKLDEKNKVLSGKAVTDDGRSWSFKVVYKDKKEPPAPPAPVGIGPGTSPAPAPGISGISPGNPPTAPVNPLAPPPGPALPNPGSLAGTIWKGTETLQDYGKLTFQLHAGGKATMIDADGTTGGTWSQNGQTITINFYDGDVTYQGSLKGTTFSGTGRNNQDGRNWSFSVMLQTSAAPQGNDPKQSRPLPPTESPGAN
jgi:hypothetical protein